MKKSKYNVFPNLYSNFEITLLILIFIQKYQVGLPFFCLNLVLVF